MDLAAVIIGGGPAGAVVGRLLATWGHSALVLEKDNGATGSRRGFSESIPPSARKLLDRSGVLADVDAAGFFRSTGNTVWWGSDERRVEQFAGDPPHGLQVFRPDFDRVLRASAETAGATVRTGCTVRTVDVDADGARVVYERNSARYVARARFVIDCSGRAGVLARRHRIPGVRTYALIGSWHTDHSWNLPDDTHTVVEAFPDGWAWSVPHAAAQRHVGVMFDGSSPAGGRRALVDAYRATLARTTHLARHLESATLHGVSACDASTYSSSQYGGGAFLLAGDAGSFIDPLSSFGVKKALGSAWLASVVVNTCVRHAERQPAALDFFADWERDVSASYAERSRAFARTAAERHATPFWTRRATADVAPRPRTATVDERSMRAAFEQIQQADGLDVTLDAQLRLERRPVVKDREIVIEEALPSGIRFVNNVDLLTLGRLAGQCRQVPELFEAYCRAAQPVPLPNVLTGLSLLVAKGFLVGKDMVRC
ncbi:MAG TPA: FAD-dependent monooxygenase [Vicinamibacterales bacterium]